MEHNLHVSFPHLGDYHIPISKFLKTAFPGQTVSPAPAMTKKTVELGSRYSPDYVCSPFKYNLGNYIEALEAGANVLLQTGMGCRYGYYGEVQEKILRDLGYDFRFVCLSRERARPAAAYKILRDTGSPLTPVQILTALILAVESIRVMDRVDYYVRENVGFEVEPGSFEKLRQALFGEIAGADSLPKIIGVGRKYETALKNIRLIKPDNVLRVGVIGELYTLMEPFSNFYIEKQLAKNNISVSRVMSVSFLLFGKNDKRTLKHTAGYLKYPVGANGIDSVAQCKRYAQSGYDGIIHMKSFGCTPEINAMPALINLSKDYKIPVLSLSFDSQTSETGVQTRLEAFSDMLSMKRDRGGKESVV